MWLGKLMERINGYSILLINKIEIEPYNAQETKYKGITYTLKSINKIIQKEIIIYK